jgi:hypothetical protein
MDIAQLVYHYLVITHHGSHYDWHVWLNYYQWLQTHKGLYPPGAFGRAARRVLAILAKGGI